MFFHQGIDIGIGADGARYRAETTVRKLAQERIAPRAREIDASQEYPQDLFELFRDTGLLGLVIGIGFDCTTRASR